MKINYTWLQDYIEEKLPPIEVLAEKIIFGAFEVENFEEIKSGKTSILDVKTLPDRNHDCLGHYGMAREISGLMGLHLKPLQFNTYESITSDVRVHIATPVVKRYLARKIFGITVKPSPAWLTERLESIGARSINNVVDATNYVMYTLGQPIHAFDYDKIGNGEINVRPAIAGEQITTLDGVLVPLDERITIIANNNHTEALAIAGVKGGTVAKVDDTTTTIVLEVAAFDASAVRKAAQQVNIHNDSSKRFENEISTHVAPDAMRMVTDLIVSLAGGAAEDIVDEYPQVEPVRTITFSADAINQKLGTQLSCSQINEILNQYSYSYEESAGDYKLVVPHTRLDITGVHDMAEEIGRVYGYENIESILPSLGTATQSDISYLVAGAVRNDLINKGYSEIHTYTFTKKGDYEVARGPVGKSALRKNLTNGMKRAYEINHAHAEFLPNQSPMAFEIGSVFTQEGEVVHVAYCDEKGSITEQSVESYAALHKLITSELPPVTQYTSTQFIPWSPYPAITRDVAVWVPESVSVDDLQVSIASKAGDYLVRGPRLFDIFTKDGRQSCAFRLVFQSYDKTLTDDEIAPVVNTIYQVLTEKGYEIR